MSAFVGDDRKALRQSILDRIAAVSDGAGPLTPRLILLEGLSGVGKSRVIREVYEALRATRVGEHPQYWPTLLPAGDLPFPGVQSATVGTRKILGPRVRGFVWDDDALPSFLWWSLNCEQLSSGDYADASLQLDEAMRWHSGAILLAWRALAPGSTQAKDEVRRAARGIRDVLVGDKWDSAMTAADVLESLASLDIVLNAVPGLGMVVKSLKGMFGRLIEERQLGVSLAQRMTYGETLEDRAQAASDLADRIRRMALPRLPVIVAVEDAHYMGDDLGALLDRLAEPIDGHPVVVLCTAWPTNDVTSPFERWKARAIREARVEVVAVGDLDEDARRGIIDALVPGTDTDVKKSLVAKWRNPLCLELFLSWDEVQRRIVESAHGPALTMTVEQVNVAPESIGALYQVRWAALAPDVKRALLTTAGCLPAGQAMHAFAADIIAEVVATDPSVVDWAVEGISEAFLAQMAAARGANWTLDLGTAETFREVDVATLVADHAQRTFAYADLQRAIARVLAAKIDGLRGDGYAIDVALPRTTLTARWLVSMNPRDADVQVPLAVARLALARDAARAWQFETALGMVGRDDVLADLDPRHRHTLAARLDIAMWIGEAGDVESARTRCEILVDACAGILGEVEPTTLVARRWLAHFTGLCGRKAQARDMFVALVNDCQWLDHARAVELNARGNAALWTGEVAEYAAAIDELTTIIPMCASFFGTHHHETLENRRLRARLTGEGGDPSGARDQYRFLVDDCLRQFGPTHAESLECRRGLGRWTTESGDPEAAIPMYRSVAADCERIYGPTHFLTLWAQIGLADALGKSGQFDEAADWARRAHREAVRAWSPSHRLVTTSAARIREWVTDAG